MSLVLGWMLVWASLESMTVLSLGTVGLNVAILKALGKAKLWALAALPTLGGRGLVGFDLIMVFVCMMLAVSEG